MLRFLTGPLLYPKKVLMGLNLKFKTENYELQIQPRNEKQV
jgi:hypothetical protein